MNMQRAPKLQWLKFSVMLLVVGAFISILIYVLVARDELVATNADVPLIKPAETPVKRRPENPGGLDIPNRDRVVFDLLSTPEEQAAASAENAEPDVIALKLTEATPVVETPAPTSAPAEKTEKVVATPPTPVAAPTPKAPAPAADAIAALLTTPEPKQAAPAPTATPKSTGSYGVQLASFALRKDADNAAKSYATKHASILGNLTADIQRADLGAKGVRYRVRFIGADSKTAANTVCRELKAKGQGCLAVSK